MRFSLLLTGLVLLAGCAPQRGDLVCRGGSLRFGERVQTDVYLTSGDVHGNNLAVLAACPEDVFTMEAKMDTAEERAAFWRRLNALQPSKALIPTGQARVLVEPRLSPDGLPTLDIYRLDELEAAFPPPQVAATLNLDSLVKPE